MPYEHLYDIMAMEDNNISFPPVRTFVYLNGISYDLVATQAYMRRMLRDDRENIAHPDYFISIHAELRHFLYDLQPPLDLMTDPYTGLYMPPDLWFSRYGLMEVVDDDITIATYSITDSDFELEGEEPNTDEEHEELRIAAVILTDLQREEAEFLDEEEGYEALMRDWAEERNP